MQQPTVIIHVSSVAFLPPCISFTAVVWTVQAQVPVKYAAKPLVTVVRLVYHGHYLLSSGWSIMRSVFHGREALHTTVCTGKGKLGLSISFSQVTHVASINA